VSQHESLRQVLRSLKRLTTEVDRMREDLRPSDEAPQSELGREQEALRAVTSHELVAVKSDVVQARRTLCRTLVPSPREDA